MKIHILVLTIVGAISPVVAQVAAQNATKPIPRTADGKLGEPTALVANAHANHLLVHPWTFRAENNFLPKDLAKGTAPSQFGDLESELLAYLRTGMDGFFTDQADLGFKVRAEFLKGP